MTGIAAVNTSTEADASLRRHAFILTAFDPAAEPRVTRLSESLESAGFDVCQIGVYAWHVIAEGPSIEQLSDRRSRVRVERTLHDFDMGPVMTATGLDSGWNLAPLLYLDFIRRQDASQIRYVAGGDIDVEQAERFQSLCSYVFDSNMALLQAARLCGSPDLIIACDFEALPAGIVAGRELGCRVIYDASQLWSSSAPGLTDWERKFWFAVEKLYAQMADHRFAVSDHRARALGQRLCVPFDSAPNAVSLSERRVDPEKPYARMHHDKVVFVFQGEFAETSGLQQLVAAWPQTDPSCVLYLRGADTPFKNTIVELAEATGLLNRRIYFPRAVAERDRVRGCVMLDVGLIPDQPGDASSRYCCPSSLSQYMAAGRPVIANKLDFVSRVIASAECGQSVDFGDLPQLLQVIKRFADDKHLRADFGRNARSYFERTFNWENQSAALSGTIRDIAAEATRKARGLDFGWIGNQSIMRRRALHTRPAVVADIPLIQSRIYAEYENRLTELRATLDEREQLLATFKTVGGLTRHGLHFLRNRFVRWRNKNNEAEKA
ncbi:MAG: glycosyltransferase family 4 protein [Xanthobacteraceae bacterium]